MDKLSALCVDVIVTEAGKSMIGQFKKTVQTIPLPIRYDIAQDLERVNCGCENCLHPRIWSSTFHAHNLYRQCIKLFAHNFLFQSQDRIIDYCLPIRSISPPIWWKLMDGYSEYVTYLIGQYARDVWHEMNARDEEILAIMESLQGKQLKTFSITNKQLLFSRYMRTHNDEKIFEMRFGVDNAKKKMFEFLPFGKQRLEMSRSKIVYLFFSSLINLDEIT
jgi:hypothetical protein